MNDETFTEWAGRRRLLDDPPHARTIERLRADLAWWQAEKQRTAASAEEAGGAYETEHALDESYADGRIAALTDALALLAGELRELESEKQA